MVTKEDNIGAVCISLIESISDICSLDLIKSSCFIAINDCMAYPHVPEFCMAWMDALDSSSLIEAKKSTYIYINCPVDICVYQQDRLVGEISNDIPKEIENGIITMVDDDGQKILVLPGDSEYKIVYKATGDGTMSLTSCEFIDANTVPSTVACYYDLPITAGSTYQGTVSYGDFSVADSSQNIISPSVVQKGKEAKLYRVEVKAEGNGNVNGGGIYNLGEFTRLTATPNKNAKFLGWYDNDLLISTDLVIRMCVKKDSTITGKFESQDINSENNKPKTYVVNKHLYRITNAKKRTVSFIGTKSKAKTIKIPSTIKINKKTYKVTETADKAIMNNKYVTKIEVGTNIVNIGSKAFYKCKKLKYVIIKTIKIKKVGKYAFKGIYSKAKIKCPSKKRKTYIKIFKKSKIDKRIKIVS